MSDGLSERVIPRILTPISAGRAGEEVADVQARLVKLGLAIDGEELAERRFAASTDRAVREFQQRRGLLVDGRVGDDTWGELVEAGYLLGDRTLYLRRPPFRGDDVRVLQSRLNSLGFDAGREDAIFGEETTVALREFQRNVGLPEDGIVGATTLGALQRLRAAGPGPGRASVGEAESIRSARGSLHGRRIGIDPGHGPTDPGGRGPGGTIESEVVIPLASQLATALRAVGALPLLLRSPVEDPSSSERAARANAAGVELLLSLHLNTHSDPAADGVSSYYFQRQDFTSRAGQRLADLIQTEVVDRTGLRDCRSHGKSFPLLRETRMPAVLVEPCFITNPDEERLLSQPSFSGAVIEGLVAALSRFFQGEDAG